MRDTDSFWTQKTVHIRIMTAIVVMSILLAAILRRPVIRYADAAARIFQIYIPILAGIILFLLCLRHRSGGTPILVAGLAEGAAAAVMFGIVLWFAARGVTSIGNVLYARGMAMLNADSGFGSLIYVLVFALFMFLLMMIPFVALAGIFRFAAARIQDWQEQNWLRETNLYCHAALMYCGFFLFFCAFLIFQTGSIGELILCGLFYGAVLTLVARIVAKLCARILE